MDISYVVKYIDDYGRAYDQYLEHIGDGIADASELKDAHRFDSAAEAWEEAERLCGDNSCTYVVVPVLPKRK